MKESADDRPGGIAPPGLFFEEFTILYATGVYGIVYIGDSITYIVVGIVKGKGGMK